jgi:hypothetical protein
MRNEDRPEYFPLLNRIVGRNVVATPRQSLV